MKKTKEKERIIEKVVRNFWENIGMEWDEATWGYWTEGSADEYFENFNPNGGAGMVTLEFHKKVEKEIRKIIKEFI